MSVILNGLDYNQYLGKLLSFLDPVLLSSGRGRFVRCWHAKTDGSDSSTFHSNCDGKGPTVTIIKSGSYIFGGYTDVSWHSGKYHSTTSILMQMLESDWPSHCTLSEDFTDLLQANGYSISEKTKTRVFTVF